MNKLSTLELDLVLDGWAAVEPSPGFADRFADRIATNEPRRWRGLPIIGAAAVALALVLAPLLLPRSHAAPALAHAEDLDAGLRTD